MSLGHAADVPHEEGHAEPVRSNVEGVVSLRHSEIGLPWPRPFGDAQGKLPLN